MKKFLCSVVCGLVLTGGVVLAQDKAGECPAGHCPAATCPAHTEVVSTTQEPAHSHAPAAAATCPISQGMMNLPAIHYMVGKDRACCAASAATMAKAKSLPIVYKVGEASFDSEESAFVNLVETTEKFVHDFATPCTCEVSGKTTIAGATCDCPVQAGEKAELVKAAMARVAVSYRVGKESCDCPVSAKEMAAKSGETITYVVADEEIGCEFQARLKTAQARYKAALTALHAAPAAPAGTLTNDKIN